MTTDGLLTDATEEEVDLCGPLTRRFQALIDRLDGGGRALERKHRVAQVVSLRTRGCLTAKAVEGEPPILAKAGVKPPMRDKAEQNRYMLDLFLNRVPGQTVDQQHLISTREQWATEADLVAITRTVKLNLDFDFKREPVNPSVELVDGAEHLTFETVPWHSAEQGQVMRALFDGWRKAGCLKSLEDFRRWQWFRDVRLHTRGRRVRVGADGAAGLLRKMFLRAYAQERWGTQKTMTYAEVAEWLTVRGYPTKVDDLKNARRAPLTEGLIPEIPEVMPLWEVLLAEQPNLDRGRFFAAQPRGAAQEPATVAPAERGSHASV